MSMESPEMNSLAVLLAAVKGYRTYLASAAALLLSIAPLFGILSPTNGMALSVAAIACAHIFQRMAQSDHALTISELAQDFSDFSDAVKPALGIIEPTKTLPFFTTLPCGNNCACKAATTAPNGPTSSTPSTVPTVSSSEQN